MSEVGDGPVTSVAIFKGKAGNVGVSSPPRLRSPVSPASTPQQAPTQPPLRVSKTRPTTGRLRSPGARSVGGTANALQDLIADLPRSRASTNGHAQPASISRRHYLTSSHAVPGKSPPRKAIPATPPSQAKSGMCVPPLKAMMSTSADRKEGVPKRRKASVLGSSMTSTATSTKLRSSSADRERERGRAPGGRQTNSSASTSSYSRPTVSAPAGLRMRSPPRKTVTNAYPSPLLANIRSEDKKRKAKKISAGSPTNYSSPDGRKLFSEVHTRPVRPLTNSRPERIDRLKRLVREGEEEQSRSDKSVTPRAGESPRAAAEKSPHPRSRSGGHQQPRLTPTSPGASSTQSRSFSKSGTGRLSATSLQNSPSAPVATRPRGSSHRPHTIGSFARPAQSVAREKRGSTQAVSAKKRSRSHDTIVKLGATDATNTSHNFNYSVSTSSADDLGEQHAKLHYGEGGYLQCHAGDILDNRYHLIQRLGRGQSSTVWLAKDNRRAPGDIHEYIAIKLTRCAVNVRCSSSHEVALLYYISTNSTVLPEDNGSGVLLNHFEHKGRHGVHVCMVFELLGKPLDALMAHNGFRGLGDIHLIKEITLSILEALSQLRKINVVHTDLKPENLMFVPPTKTERLQLARGGAPGSLTSSPTVSSRAPKRVKISDFGLSFLLEDDNGLKPNGEPLDEEDYRVIRASNYVKGALIQTREYRAPEIILGNDFNCQTDIWSVACIVYEMVTGRFLFDPKSKPGVVNEHTNDVEHLSEISQLIGVPSEEVLGDGVNVSKLYDRNNRLRSFGDGVINRIPDVRGNLERHLGRDDADEVFDFIQSCLTWSPMTRPTAAQCLQHPWLAHHYARMKLRS